VQTLLINVGIDTTRSPRRLELPGYAKNGELAETWLLVHPTPPIQKPNAAI